MPVRLLAARTAGSPGSRWKSDPVPARNESAPLPPARRSRLARGLHMAFFAAAVRPMSGSAIQEPSGLAGATRQQPPGRRRLLPPGPGSLQERRHQRLRFDVSPNEHDSASRNERSTEPRYGISSSQMQMVMIRIRRIVWYFARVDDFVSTKGAGNRLPGARVSGKTGCRGYRAAVKRNRGRGGQPAWGWPIWDWM